MFIKRSALHALGHLFSNGYPADIIEETPRDQSLIHISELTGCALKLWLNLKEQAPVSAYTSMPMAIGRTLHELTQSILKAIDPEIGVEVPVSYLPAYPVIGKADLVDSQYVIDLKFLSDWGFKSYFDSPYKHLTYKIQVLAYAKALNKPLAAVFIINRGNLGFKAQVYPVKQNEEELVYYLNRAKDIYESKTGPPKSHLTSNNFECHYCPYKERCWSE